MLDSEVPITLEGLAEMFHVSHAETESDAFMELQLAMQKPLNQNSHAIDFPFKAAIGALVVATLHQEPWPSDRLIGMLLKNITKSLAANGEALSQASNVEKPELTSMAVLLCLFCHTISSIQASLCKDSKKACNSSSSSVITISNAIIGIASVLRSWSSASWVNTIEASRRLAPALEMVYAVVANLITVDLAKMLLRNKEEQHKLSDASASILGWPFSLSISSSTTWTSHANEQSARMCGGSHGYRPPIVAQVVALTHTYSPRAAYTMISRLAASLEQSAPQTEAGQTKAVEHSMNVLHCLVASPSALSTLVLSAHVKIFCMSTCHPSLAVKRIAFQVISSYLEGLKAVPVTLKPHMCSYLEAAMSGLKDKDGVVRGRMTSACGQFLVTVFEQSNGQVCNFEESRSVVMRTLDEVSQRLVDAAPSVRKKAVHCLTACAEVLAGDPQGKGMLEFVIKCCMPQIKAFLLAWAVNEEVCAPKDILALCKPFTSVHSSYFEMLLLTSNFPKLQLVLNPTSLGTPLLLQGIADWLPIVAGLSHDQVVSLAQHVRIQPHVGAEAFTLLHNWLTARELNLDNDASEPPLHKWTNCLKVIGLCKPGTFNVADSMGEAHILIRVLYNFLARYSTAPSRRPEAVDWPPSGADQACLEVTLEPNGGEAVAPVEAIADGYGDKCTDSSEECSDELEQCVCAALHCLHCALQNGLEREAPAAFFQSLLACLTEMHIAIGSTGEEASAILHEVFLAMPDHQEVLDAVFKRQLSIVREAGIEVPSLVLSELICLFETLAQSFHQKCNDFKGALRKQHEGSDVAKEKPEGNDFDYMEGEDQEREDDALAQQYVRELVCGSCAAPYVPMLADLALADNLQPDLRAKAVKSLASFIILDEEYSAHYMEVLVQSMADGSETVRAQAYASGCAVAAQWPALPNGLSEQCLHTVGTAATTDTVDVSRHAAASSFRSALLKGTIKVYTFLGRIADGVISDDSLVQPVFADLLNSLLDQKSRSRPQVLVDLFSQCRVTKRAELVKVLRQSFITDEDRCCEHIASSMLESFVHSTQADEQASFALFLAHLTPSARLLGNLLKFLEDRGTSGACQNFSSCVVEHLKVFVQNFRSPSRKGKAQGMKGKCADKSKTVVDGILSLLQQQSKNRARKRKGVPRNSPSKPTELDHYKMALESFASSQSAIHSTKGPQAGPVILADLFDGTQD